MIQAFIYTKSWAIYVSGSAAGALWTIVGWWWSVIKTLFTLLVQLCFAVSSTAIAYFIIKYSYPFVIKIVVYVILPSPPPPQRRSQSSWSRSRSDHDHDPHRSQEYTAYEEHVLHAFLHELLRRREEQEMEDEKEREWHRRNSAKKKGKGKRKGKGK
jgi:hypothetical protein